LSKYAYSQNMHSHGVHNKCISKIVTNINDDRPLLRTPNNDLKVKRRQYNYLYWYQYMWTCTLLRTYLTTFTWYEYNCRPNWDVLPVVVAPFASTRLASHTFAILLCIRGIAPLGRSRGCYPTMMNCSIDAIDTRAANRQLIYCRMQQ
jgi:hypothetical protein